LDDAEPRAVVLVPLDDDPARHRRGLERHDVVEPASGDHHPARVLAEMPRQVLDPRPERGEAPDPRGGRIAAGLGQMLRQELLRILIAPVGDELREPITHVARAAEPRPGTRMSWVRQYSTMSHTIRK